MRRWLLLIFAFPLVVFCQSNEPDSLDAELHKARGKKRVDVLNQLGLHFQATDSVKCAEYFRKAIEEAEELGDYKGRAEAHHELGVMHFRLTGNDKKAIRETRKAIEYFKKAGENQEAGRSLDNMSTAFLRHGDLDSALFYIRKAEALMPEKLATREDTGILASIYNTQALVYDYKSDYKKAINYYFKSLQFEKQLGDELAIADLCFNIATAYFAMEYFDQTIEYLKKAWELNKHSPWDQKAYILNTLGTVYGEKKMYEKAIDQYDKILEHEDSISAYSLAVSLGNKGIALFELGRNQEAISILDRSLAIKKKLGRKANLIYGYMNLAEAYRKTGLYKKAMAMTDSALVITEETGHLDEKKDLLQIKSFIYSDMGEYQAAFSILKEQNSLKDSLFNKEVAEQVEEIRAKYETAEKEREIQKLEKEAVLRKLENQRQQKYIFLLLLTLVIIAAAGGFLMYRKQQTHKNELKEQEISFQKQLLKETIEAQEEERQRIAKDLHDGVGQQLGGLKMAVQALAPDGQEEKGKLEKISAVLDETAEEVRNISHQMMPKVLSDQGLINALDDMLEKNFRFHRKINYSFEHHGIENRLPKYIEIGLYRICQELVSNIVKHSEADHVSVQALRSGKQLALIVEDNGKGFDRETRQEGGIGMKTIESRINSISGKINFEPSPGAGTIATVRVPLDE